MCILDKINYLLKKQNKSQSSLCSHLGLNQQAFTNWKNGNSSSYKKYLPEIAEYLEVSVDYLVGNTDIKEKAPAIQELSKNQKDIIRLFDKLSPKEQKLAFQIISLLAEGDID